MGKILEDRLLKLNQSGEDKEGEEKKWGNRKKEKGRAIISKNEWQYLTALDRIKIKVQASLG